MVCTVVMHTASQFCRLQSAVPESKMYKEIFTLSPKAPTSSTTHRHLSSPTSPKDTSLPLHWIVNTRLSPQKTSTMDLENNISSKSASDSLESWTHVAEIISRIPQRRLKASKFVTAKRKVYRSMGFSKGYNVPLCKFGFQLIACQKLTT